jgi:tetratricopeptide (TPR) repeat protein
MRMGQQDRALSELESYITHLESQNKKEPALSFLEDLVREHDGQPLLKRTLAALLYRMGRMAEAIPVLDQLGEVLLEKGDKQGAMDVINQIVLMNPPNVEDYRALLNQMRNGV